MKLEDLPTKIPVFPLSNFIIFPKTSVPLNIFEPRYIDMINDSIKSNKLIGMIQPKKQITSRMQYLNFIVLGAWEKLQLFKSLMMEDF